MIVGSTPASRNNPLAVRHFEHAGLKYMLRSGSDRAEDPRTLTRRRFLTLGAAAAVAACAPTKHDNTAAHLPSGPTTAPPATTTSTTVPVTTPPTAADWSAFGST